ncbi:MAG: bifunctional glycosyltransferase family 2/GtrA family protein [Gammaproteobacteria bacterium]|nr:bifunctional glycosyltransferase family 2/GtrA family protein [Gammaproteobacteria bacterium]
MNIIALIPAYNPADDLVPYVRELLASDISQVIVVNDGSLAEYRAVFAQLKTLSGLIVLEHAVNLGKGAALKTGLNYAACNFPQAVGVLTIDADGQHLLNDALTLANALINSPDHLIMGSRHFGKDVPFRSKFGNIFTRYTFRALTGIKLSDTQSGLRAIPMDLIPCLLKIAANGYEFELDMLVTAHRHGWGILEAPIVTVYIDNNKSSHFRPLRDSLRIYFVLFRFSIIALLSAILDYGIFISIYYFVIGNVMLCLVAGRLVSTVFNYLNVKKYAFHSKGDHKRTLPKYVALAITSTVLAYVMIVGLISLFTINIVIAKLISEMFMFVLNFLVQRDFIFKRTQR